MYSLLAVVFSSSTASGVFRNASSSAPQTSEEEQFIEKEYLSGGEFGGSEVGAETSTKADGKGKHVSDVELEYLPGNRRMKKKNSGSDKYNAFMEAWSQSMNARKERDLAKAERYKSQSNNATSSASEKYTIEDCMDVLNNLPEISTTSYNKALQYFVSVDWRKFFLNMTKDRKLAWLHDLK